MEVGGGVGNAREGDERGKRAEKKLSLRQDALNKIKDSISFCILGTQKIICFIQYDFLQLPRKENL